MTSSVYGLYKLKLLGLAASDVGKYHYCYP